MNKKVIMMLCFLFPVACGYSETLEPFTSDGCSSFPDGTVEHKTLWLNCCVEHDKAYWKGGTEQQRVRADLNLEECVASVGKPNIAKLMLSGVRVGGSPYWPTGYRWGYGWKFPKKYGELTKNEKTQVEKAWKEYLKGEEQSISESSH